MPYKTQSRQSYVLERPRRNVKPQLKLKTRPVSKTTVAKVVSAPVVKTVSEPVRVKVDEKGIGKSELLGTRTATVRYRQGSVSLTAKVRYETEKVDSLIKTISVADGVQVHKKFIGPPKEEKWLDDNGKEHDKSKVQLMQVLPDGKWKPIKIEKTDDIELEPVAKETVQEFHPYSYIEMFGSDTKEDSTLQRMAKDMVMTGKIGAIKKFSHGVGGKVYVGFLYPVLSKDGKSFTVEVMLSENRRRRRRWMAVQESETKGKEKTKDSSPEVPKLF